MSKEYSNVTVLVDMDDTIEYLLPAWTEWINTRYGTSVQPDEITDWNVQNFFPALSRDEVYAPLFDNDFWSTVKPREDAILYLPKIMDLGFNLYICTTSNYQTIRIKLQNIIDRYFPFIPWERVITTTNKQLLNADILVDDGVHNLVGGAYKKILMSASHNKNYNAHDNDMIRVYDWKEAYEKIIEYSDQILVSKTNKNMEKTV